MEQKRLFGIIPVFVIGIILISGCLEKKCESDADCLAKTCFTVQCTDNKCVYPPVTNCCGNKICEEGVEGYSSCPTDCPNCDDNNKLTADSFNYATQKCENIVTHYLIEDFDEGSASWDLGPEWSVTNGMLTNSEQAYTGFGDATWTDYAFSFKVKLEQGDTVAFGYVRAGYAVSFYEDLLVLAKDVEPQHINLEEKSYAFGLNQFHDIRIEAKGNDIKVYVDDNLEISYTDTDNPFQTGAVGLEVYSPTIGRAYFDNVEVEILR